MTTMPTPFTLPSPFTYSAPPAARVAFLPKLLKPNKKMQGLPKSPSSLVFYSLSSSDNPYAREGRVFSQLRLPLFPRNDAQLAEAITLPVLDMEHSFHMPISALPGLFSRLVQVPLYRQPNTLGWAGLDSQLPNFTRSAEETIDFSPLSGLLHFLPHFLPSTVKPLIQHYLFDDQRRYDLHALTTSNPTIFSLEPHLNL